MAKNYYKLIILIILICSPLIAIEGCSSYENYLHRTYHYGHIIEIKDKEIIFEIGYKERVRIGEIVNAYKMIKASPGFTRRYKKITMGVLEITDFESDQYAKAKLFYGHIDKDCTIDL